MKILVVAPSWIGDAVMMQPLLMRLRELYPATEIDVLAPAWCAPLLARMPEISRIIDNPFPHGVLDLAGRRALGRRLSRAGYACAYVLPNSWKSALVPFFANIPARIGYLGEARFFLLTRWLRKSRLPRLVDRYLALAGPLPSRTPQPHLSSSPLQQRQAREALGLPLDAEPIVFCPGAEFGPAKRWPASHFARLAELLHERFGHPVWLLGSAKDAPIGKDIARLAGKAVADLTGRTSLAQAIDLIAGAKVVVTNDSGLMHVAAALARPLVAIFGSSSPRYTPPLSSYAKILTRELPCSPCFARECPLRGEKSLACLTGISPQQVFQAMVEG